MIRLVAFVLMVAATPVFAEDDPRKLAEAGFSAFRNKDLDTAEKLTREAIGKAGGDDDVKGAALYNLGQILEAKKDKPGATQAYKDSIALRKNGIVRDALRALDAAAADASDTYAPKPMQGPFNAMDDYCKQWLVKMEPSEQKQYLPECAKAPALAAKKAFKTPAGFESVELLAQYNGDGLVRAKVGGKIYIAALSPYQESGRCNQPTWTLAGATMHGSAIELDYGITGNCNDRDGSVQYEETGIIVVGIGASKQPSATSFRSATIEDNGSKKKSFNQTRKLTWTKDNTGLDVKIVTDSGDAFEETGRRDSNDIRGHHTIALP